MRHGGQILIDQLEAQGTSTIFTVPGESFLAALDGLHGSSIRTVICRQEGGAAMMAEAWGKATGEPGVCFVTRGPGVANAMSGLHVAQQDSTPMIMFAGLPRAIDEDREAFQAIETKRLLSSFVKWVGVIRETRRIPEYVSHAYHAAMSGRPGPVVLGLPEDMLSAHAQAGDAKRANVAEPAPSDAAMDTLHEHLTAAERPLMIIGGPGWSPEVQRDVQAFSERWSLPVATAFRCQDFIDNRRPNYAGHAGIGIHTDLADAIRQADLLITVGARLGEMTTSAYGLIDIPNPASFLVHAHPSSDELGSVYRADLAIPTSAAAFARRLNALPAPASTPAWASRTSALAQAARDTWEPIKTPGNCNLEAVIAQVSEHLPDDAIITNGAGNYAAFVHRYFRYKGYRTQLSPTSGSMGYGLPAAIAAKLANPERPVVAFAGDGCFMMTSQELATALQYDLPMVIIIANNGMYGTIRMHQERHYPERIAGTTLLNPDFAAFARSFGARGEVVETTQAFLPAFKDALAADVPTVIELKIDAEALTPRQTLSDIRAGS
ncbi:MAG: thiamine pyrophosphate-binding protein [Pseudomonadota bacterium]